MPDPFTIDHFEAWVQRLVLDNGEQVRLEDFQREFVDDIFGLRPIHWLVVPEGNGKTTLLASLGLYGLRFAAEAPFGSPDAGAQIPIAASARGQATVMYRQMKGFVQRSGLRVPEDGLWFEDFDGYRRIDLRSTDGRSKRGEVLGTIEVHAADAGTADGVIPFPFAFLDELHRHKDLSLHRTWSGKLDKRGALLVVISTAGVPGHDFELTRDKLRGGATEKLERGSFGRYVSDRIVMREYAVRDKAMIEDMAAVKEANPLPSITVESLAAKRADPTMSDSHWKRFTCNIASQTDAEMFIDAREWEALASEESVIPKGAAITIGADGSRTWDTTVVAWATCFEETIDVDCRVFSVRPDVEHHVFHEGGKVDFDDVEAFLISLFDDYAPVETAYDPRYLERSMEIVDLRLPDTAVIAVEPSSKHARDAYQALFTAVIEGRLRHRGDPVIAAHLNNTTVDRDDRTREIRRLRKIDPRLPIDAVPALALAVWRAILATPSVYVERGAIVV